MRISIAMTTYNGAKYIDQQLESLANQTKLPYELVVTDDGSTDDTLAIVERFSERAPFPVRVYRNETRLNYADNFLRAASLCDGDWIAFCDQDDVWLKEKLEWVSRSAREDVAMVVHRVQAVDEALRPIPRVGVSCRVRRGRKLRCLPPMGFFSGLTITFNASLLDLLMQRPRFPDFNEPSHEAAHDQWVSSVADAVGSVKYINKALVLYRQHGANTYGAYVRPFWGISLDATTTSDASAYRTRAEVAQRYSECFHRLALSPAASSRKADLEATALRYRAMRDYLLARAALYSAKRFPARLRLMAGMTLRWSYRFNPLRPSLFAFMKDLFIVLIKTG